MKKKHCKIWIRTQKIQGNVKYGFEENWLDLVYTKN